MHFLKSRIGPFLRFVLETGQRFKMNITPNHFYSEIPDLAMMRREKFWRAPMSMIGVPGTDTAAQLAWVRACCAPTAEQRKTKDVHGDAIRRNGEVGYGPIEAEFLYCFIRSQKPAKIIQVGCGVTTAIILQAAADEGYTPKIVCMEPYPTKVLRDEHDAGRIQLIPEMAQKAALEQLTDLRPGDLLFVDSTHTIKPGSEVVRIMLEVLPRLAPGVWAHFHDIFFPYDYNQVILTDDVFFTRESTLLHAFLAMNNAWTIAASMSMLHHLELKGMQEIFPKYRPRRVEAAVVVQDGHFPSATYIRRLEPGQAK